MTNRKKPWNLMTIYHIKKINMTSKKPITFRKITEDDIKEINLPRGVYKASLRRMVVSLRYIRARRLYIEDCILTGGVNFDNIFNEVNGYYNNKLGKKVYEEL